MAITRQDVLEYHSRGRAGKIEVIATKPLATQLDLSLAYSPGVAEAVLVIEEDPANAYRYTAKGNLVAVVSNGTAILGLGDRGPLASKPVMEGKGVLFKTFADIDVFDIEVNTKDPKELIEVVAAIAPTFGGINLEDIKAPECFEVEETLKARLPIPVFHDDQHGTAIISAAGLINALEINGKRIEDLRVAISGAGASAIACANLYIRLGVKIENILMCDSRGVIHDERDDLNKYKLPFARKTKARTLTDAMVDADVFLGLSTANVVSEEMAKSMAKDPIIFAMANPKPEIPYPLARQARPDAIIGTGRSDFPNQVNNVLGFPFIFRGALDVAATAINEEMKLAAAHALAALAHEDVPDSVLAAYGVDSLHFGQDYVIPKPLDRRVLLWEAPAVAKAAMDTGVATLPVDLDEYRERLRRRQGLGQQVKHYFVSRARKQPKRIVFAEGTSIRIIRAAAHIADQKIGHPILLGDPDKIKQIITDLEIHFDPEIINPSSFEKLAAYEEAYYQLRQRKGETIATAHKKMVDPYVLGPMMVYMGDADVSLGGISASYTEVIRPALQIFHTLPGVRHVSGLYLVLAKDKAYVFTDATINFEPDAETLAEIAILANDFAKNILEIKPEVAMLSFSNFGSTRHPLADKVREATAIVKKLRPDIHIDGELQADFAVSEKAMEELFPFSDIRNANVLVFPDLEAANISQRLVTSLSGAESIGPILVGLGAPIYILPQNENVENIVALTAVAVADAQLRGK